MNIYISIVCFLACVLSGVFIFLLGRWIGKMEQESKTRQDIKNTGLFMLNDGFYQATKVNKSRQVIEPETLQHAFRQPEKPNGANHETH